MNKEQGLFKSRATVLEGKFIQLEPMIDKHRQGLHVAANHEEIWKYMPYQATQDGFNLWFNDSLNKMSSGTQITYIVRKKLDQRILGATAYYDIQVEHKRLALGYSWYIPEVWGTVINSEAKLLMLEQAFDVFNMNRVELGTDSRNIRSYHAIKKLGATEEGVLRQHMILHDDALTDTILFSILSTEWPTIKVKLNQTVCSD
jgi:N-acetyltransferase